MPESGEEEVKPASDNKLSEVLDRLSSVISTKFAPAPVAAPPPERFYTRAELNDAVVTGTMAQATADEIHDRQEQRRIMNAAAAAVQNHSAEQTVSAEIGEYKRLVPDILVEGSAEHGRLKEEYQRQIARGLPQTIATELVALEIVFGKASALEAAKNPKRNNEHHQDVGGGDGTPGRVTGPLSKIPARNREYYQDQIRKGMYTGPDDPDLLAELKYIRAA